ncbi:hypothetical protein G6045_08765 [Streptomyces sp. YC504]|uniref:Uncharacterized protein n=1 Tax=Streptomyces mesophilus TaxID=1775132 RepID=A0A6G4XGB7_9ACTN|nr:hypothetical protein [Streptomyces mesophilus]NGO75764.1 hypothetical protein [Streptomyces mesophilus]
MFTTPLARMIAAVRRHFTKVRSAARDAGYSVTEWAAITAFGGLIAGAIYVAINTKAQEKIAQIMGI